MFKLGTGLVGLVIVTAIWLWRQKSMKERMKGFDDGTLCIGCHSRNMTIRDNHAICGDCGHRSDLAAMRATQLTDDQIKDLTRPQ